MNRKQNRGNGFLYVALLLMTAAMLIFTGWMRGLFDSPEAEEMQLLSAMGDVTLERLGIAFHPQEGIRLRKGDSLVTGTDATASAMESGVRLDLRPETELCVTGSLWKLEKGSIFLDARSADSLALDTPKGGVILENAVALVEADLDKPTVLLLGGNCDADVIQPDLTDLDDTTLADLQSLAESGDLFWSGEEIAGEAAGRERSRQKELQEKLAAAIDHSEGALSCTIQISCSSVWKHSDWLNQEKKPYIPADGMILTETEVNFADGESVLDILERVCTAAEIPLEYNFTPAYKSYYIEGINHLYEFDCGPASGWTYRVNGDYPNYGCSSCLLKDGDRIEWLYTCDYTSDTDQLE